jgi:hypothetical protein
MDLSQFAVDGLVVVAVFIIMNLIGKPLVEVFLKPDAPSHDVVVRGIAVLLGVIGIYLDHGFPATADGHALLLLTVGGILSGASAIGVYHVTQSGSASPTPLAGTFTVSEGVTPPIDYAALAAALEPVMARFVPGLVAPATAAPEHIILPASATLPPAVAPQSPAPEPAAPAAPPAPPA